MNAVIALLVDAEVMYLNCSPSTKEPLVSSTSSVPLMYALAPVVVVNVLSMITALAPVLTPTTVNPVVSCCRPVFCWKSTRNLSGPKTW